MRFSDALICVLFTTLAASYGWGMRGALIGGEKGAMLPGAFIGLALSAFAGACGGIGVMAAGLMGMTFGGTEPYGETIGMVLHRGGADYNRVKGYTGLAFKGALWFSVCGGFMAMAFSYNVYSQKDILVFCLLIPVIQQIGYWIFNTPYDRVNGKYPKIFFSVTRREEWGSNLTLLIALIAMAVIRNDSLALLMITFGFIFGALGWAVAMGCYEISTFPLRNGKYLFGKLFHNGLIDGWKIMEFVFGAFGGFGLSLAFCIGYDYIKIYNERISLDGVEYFDEHTDDWIPIICILCAVGIFAVNLISHICDKHNKNVSSFVLDRIERIFYSVIPMIFVLWGNIYSAMFMTGFILVFVIVIKLIFDRFEIVNAFSLIVSLAVCVVAYIFFVTNGASPMKILFAGTVPYIVSEFASQVVRKQKHGKSVRELVFKTPFATVFPAFIVMSVLLYIVVLKIF